MRDRLLRSPRWVVLVVLGAACVSFAVPVGTAPSAVDLVLATEFTRIDRVDDFTPTIAASVATQLDGRRLVNPPRLAKANPTAPESEATLLLAGRSPSVWFAHYQVGGASPGYHLVVVSVDSKGSATVAGHLRLQARAWSVAELKNVIRRGDFEPVE